jgi:hypothetical protein
LILPFEGVYSGEQDCIIRDEPIQPLGGFELKQ